MRLLKAMWVRLTGVFSRGPYQGRLDSFTDADQQDIISNRFRSGM